MYPQVVSEITSWLRLGGALRLESSVQALAKTTHAICAAMERNVTPVSCKKKCKCPGNMHFRAASADT